MFLTGYIKLCYNYGVWFCLSNAPKGFTDVCVQLFMPFRAAWGIFMKDIEFDIELTTKELYSFSMRHAYVSVSGVCGIVISLGSLAICAIGFKSYDFTTNFALIVIGLLFTVVQPIMLLVKSSKQIRRNRSINEPLHYRFSDKGITVRQGEQKAQVHWYEVRRRVQTAKALYLYMSPVRAFIFPKEQCEKEFGSMVSLVKAMMEKYKDYDPTEDEQSKDDMPRYKNHDIDGDNVSENKKHESDEENAAD